MQYEGASENISSKGEFFKFRTRHWMYSTASAGMEKGGQLYSAVGSIAHEHHEGGCVPCSE
jgi:hypothetical protein